MSRAAPTLLLATALVTLLRTPAAESILVRDTTVVPMTSSAALEHHSVLVEDGRIAAVAPAGSLEAPPDARVIDGAGRYLLPGLADLHVHVTRRTPYSPFNLFLANGVTTVRDLDGTPSLLAWRRAIEAGRRPGPTVLTSGPIIGFNLEHKAELVALHRELGYDCIKVYGFLAADDLTAVQAAAAEHGVYSVGHVSLPVGLEGVLDAGVDEIAHLEELLWQLVDLDTSGHHSGQASFMPRVFERLTEEYGPLEGLSGREIEERIAPRAREIVAAVARSGASLTTTLSVGEVVTWKVRDPRGFLARPSSRFLPESFRDRLLDGSDKHVQLLRPDSEVFELGEHASRVLLRGLVDAGVRVVLGTDVQQDVVGVVPGFSLHDELRLAVEHGLTPYEALAACTRVASRVVADMTGVDDFGTIEVGKRADLLLLDANPLEDVANAQRPAGVIARGRWYSRDALTRLQETPARTVSVTLLEVYAEAGLDALLARYEVFERNNPRNAHWLDDNELLLVAHNVLARHGALDDVRAICERNVEAYPESSRAWAGLAGAHSVRGDEEKALDCLRTALRLDPNNAVLRQAVEEAEARD